MVGVSFYHSKWHIYFQNENKLKYTFTSSQTKNALNSLKSRTLRASVHASASTWHSIGKNEIQIIQVRFVNRNNSF
ncbi:MAG: hypothetical protein CSA03_02275 [Bacteroidetes bacterium]|nr:MAG: hypothetical protein CSA03_02275 [Bacteroidota bacterium]